MAVTRLLIANRGEIAVRIARAARELDITTTAVYAEDEAASLHVVKCDRSVALAGAGAQAYLDVDALVRAALDDGCDALHPGYGFLSENAALADACEAAGLIFVGPRPGLLRLFGDKVRARAAASDAGVPVLDGTTAATSLDECRNFFAAHPAGVMIKAVAGGGGRGMRAVTDADALDDAYERCRSEARAAFGDDEVYVEELISDARHIEVQIVGDGDRVVHLGERDCSIQRRHQKIVEIAPSPGLSAEMRDTVAQAAVGFASAVGYSSLGTFEFLVTDSRVAFIEANARLQVEHTITEQVTGVDLVRSQLLLAGGGRLGAGDLALPEAVPDGFAVQVRVNMERMTETGDVVPSGGVLTAFEPPSGPGVRTDTFGYAGYATSPRYDSLLAKVIGHRPGGSYADALKRTCQALQEFRVDGVATNIDFALAVLTHEAVVAGNFNTRFVDDHIAALVNGVAHVRRHFPAAPEAPAGTAAGATPSLAGARIDSSDPLAVLDYGQVQARAEAPAAAASAVAPAVAAAPDGTVPVTAPLQGTIVSLDVAEQDVIAAGQTVAIMESMKMEHEVRAEVSGTVRSVGVAAGDTVYEGHALLFVEAGDVDVDVATTGEDVDLDYIRPDLDEVAKRHDKTLDAARPEAVARRHGKNQRTARENVEHLCDPGSFVEYGSLVLAAQRRRRSIEDLIDKTPADGMITGVGAINGDLFGDPAARSVVMAYDYTVLAGTQGGQNHRKTDRMIEVAESGTMPMVLFAEGGGGRPGDTDGIGTSEQRTFSRFAQLSGLVPMIGITSGRCFAGNASLLGCCDVIIATAGSNIGMGGPAMIEGGGLGIYAPEEIGPMDVQVPNGVVDVLVDDETAAVDAAKRYLSYFQGRLPAWEAPDQRAMRRIVPENRLRVYEVRDVVATLADEGSIMEIRPEFGTGMITSLIRVEGRAVGVIANNPRHLGGAIDSDGADKGARFMQLCDAFDVPLLYLCDTPGIMVGPEIERTALVRHSSRMFVIGANLSVPFFTVILRKAYGLGAIAMAGGSYKVPTFSVSWPTGEFGGMGLEGSVKLGYRNELAAIEDPQARAAKYEEMVARAYESGKALNHASLFGVDDTIDPADTRWWLASLLNSIRTEPRRGKKRAAIDAW